MCRPDAVGRRARDMLRRVRMLSGHGGQSAARLHGGAVAAGRVGRERWTRVDGQQRRTRAGRRTCRGRRVRGGCRFATAERGSVHVQGRGAARPARVCVRVNECGGRGGGLEAIMDYRESGGCCRGWLARLKVRGEEEKRSVRNGCTKGICKSSPKCQRRGRKTATGRRGGWREDVDEGLPRRAANGNNAQPRVVTTGNGVMSDINDGGKTGERNPREHWANTHERRRRKQRTRSANGRKVAIAGGHVPCPGRLRHH